MLARMMSRYEAYAPLPLRMVVGVIFLAHGAQKLFGAFGGYGVSGTAQLFEQIGITPGIFWAVVVGLVEFGGGLAVLIGLLTRYAATLLAINMLVAILRVHLVSGFFLPTGFEYALALFGASLTLLIGGAGHLSFDHYFAQARRHRRTVKQPAGVAT
jgi:putative oxidoreductase